ncbi:MAG: DUF3626 domain-containing protein, partial [Microcoleus sp. T3-bin5]|nr:DUF3626 domain-containing protein [Microcoleus sp. T3-bin5]
MAAKEAENKQLATGNKQAASGNRENGKEETPTPKNESPKPVQKSDKSAVQRELQKQQKLFQKLEKEVEELNGNDQNSDPTERPLSAYFAGNDLNGASHASVSQAYGSIAVKLKPQVKERVTFTGSDSFKSGIPSDLNANGTPPAPNAASIASLTRHGYDLDKLPSNYPSFMKDKSVHRQQLTDAAKAKNIDDLAPSLAPTGNTYVEAQVHGQLKPEDIGELHFTPKAADGSDKPNAAIAKWAKDNGVKIYTNGKEEDLDKLINPPQKTKTQEISDAIDKGDFGKVADFATDIAKRSKVKAASNEGVWAEKQIAIVIKPPWWRTWWAYT